MILGYLLLLPQVCVSPPQTLFASVPSDGARFGISVARSGERIMVGAENHLLPTWERKGAVHHFESTGAGWIEVERIDRAQVNITCASCPALKDITTMSKCGPAQY